MRILNNVSLSAVDSPPHIRDSKKSRERQPQRNTTNNHMNQMNKLVLHIRTQICNRIKLSIIVVVVVVVVVAVLFFSLASFALSRHSFIARLFSFSLLTRFQYFYSLFIRHTTK